MDGALSEPALLAGIDVTQARWRVSAAQLERVVGALGLPDADVDAIVAVVSLQEAKLAPFEMRVGKWSVDVPAAVGRGLFNSVVLASVLAALHEPPLPVAAVAFVTSMLFDVQRVEVPQDRKHVYAMVLDARGPGATVEDWYLSQSGQLRAELTEAEFREIAEQFEDVLPGEPAGENPGWRYVKIPVSPGRPQPAADQGTAAPTVFITYAHDSAEHKQQVRTLAELLKHNGIKVILDQWATTHRRDWSTWAPEAIITSDFTLMIASPAFKRAGDGFGDPVQNPGVQSETAVIRDQLHGDRARWRRKLLPVLLPGHQTSEIPYFMQPNSADWYRVDSLTDAGVRELVNVISGEPETVGPGTGEPDPRRDEVRWRSLANPVDPVWRAELPGRSYSALVPALELHLVPVGGERLTMSRLQQLPDLLAAHGRAKGFFSAAEGLDVTWSEQAALVGRTDRASGLAVLRNGQLTAWVPLLAANIGFIINTAYAQEKFASLLDLLTGLGVDTAAPLAPAVAVEPLQLVREAPASDASASSASLDFAHSPPARVTGEDSLTREEIVSSPEAVAVELAARLTARLHGLSRPRLSTGTSAE